MPETLLNLPLLIVSFLLRPRAFLASVPRTRVDFDAEGRCVNPDMWADGLNPDGSRKDGLPSGSVLPWTAVFK